MEVKKIVEGMTAVEVAEVIDSNFKGLILILEEDIAKQNNVIGVSEYKDFSEAEAVNVGDVRKYNGLLYECVEATTGAFDASKWKATSFKKETEAKITELGSKAVAVTTVSNNATFNACVRELYAPQVVIDSIKKIRLYNGFGNFFGIKCYDDNNSTILSIVGSNRNTIVDGENGCIVMYPDGIIEDGGYKDFDAEQIAINAAIKDLSSWPIISSYTYNKNNLVRFGHSNMELRIETGRVNINQIDGTFVIDVPPRTRLFIGDVNFYITGTTPAQYTIVENQVLYVEIPTETKTIEEVVEIKIGNISDVSLLLNVCPLIISGGYRNINGGLLFGGYLNGRCVNLNNQMDYLSESFGKAEICDLYLLADGTWSVGSRDVEYKGLILYCKGKKTINITVGSENNSLLAFLKNKKNITNGATPNYSEGSGRTVLTKNTTKKLSVPLDAEYVYISDTIHDLKWLPESITFDDELYNYAVSLYENINSQFLSIQGVVGEVKGVEPTSGYIHSSDTWAKGNYGCFIEIPKNTKVIELTYNGSYPTIYGLLKSKNVEFSSKPDYAEGCERGTLTSGVSLELNVPSDAKFLWVSYEVNGNSWFPKSIKFDGVDISKDRIEALYEKTKELDKRIETVENKESNSLGYYFNDLKLSPNLSALNVRKPLIYEADTKTKTNHLVNAVIYPNGVVIGARVGGSIVKVDLEGNEITLLTINGASDWRCLWMDKDLNVFASPHASISSMSVADRGLYKLAYGSDTFIKVLSLYNVNSSIPSETEDNDDTIWTMCQDNEGNLYAGVYAHTKRYNPAIYKSTDNGNTWDYHYNFIDSGLAASGHHIHTIIYNQYDNALYCIVGEKNTVFKSVDGAVTWVDMNCPCEYDKGSAMFATPTGILIGSDGAYNCAVAKLYPNGEVKTKGVASANTIFGFRQSDITGRIYAICKIDSSVGVESYFPPIGAINDDSVIQEWKNSVSDGVYQRWLKYRTLTETLYKDDAIKPQHFMIMASDDEGETWYVVYREFAGAYGASGLWTAGYFRNGECLVGRIIRKQSGSWEVANPLVIFDGTYKYASDGISVEGSSLIKTNNSSTVVQK